MVTRTCNLCSALDQYKFTHIVNTHPVQCHKYDLTKQDFFFLCGRNVFQMYVLYLMYFLHKMFRFLGHIYILENKYCVSRFGANLVVISFFLLKIM